jgi:putative transposase
MTKTRRAFTPEERLSLLQEAEREGYTETCRKYNLSPSMLSGWRKKYQARGADGLKPAYRRVDPVLRELQAENERLKRIISRQALELEVKTEMLKKTPIQPKKR